MSTRKKVKGPWEIAADGLVDTVHDIGQVAISKAQGATADASLALARARTRVDESSQVAKAKIRSTVTKAESRIQKATDRAKRTIAKAIDRAGRRVLAVAEKAERKLSRLDGSTTRLAASPGFERIGRGGSAVVEAKKTTRGAATRDIGRAAATVSRVRAPEAKRASGARASARRTG